MKSSILHSLIVLVPLSVLACGALPQSEGRGETETTSAALTRSSKFQLPPNVTAETTTLRLALFSDVTVSLTKRRSFAKGDGSFTWFGRTESGTAADARLRFSSGKAKGVIRMGKRLFQIDTDALGATIVSEGNLPADLCLTSPVDVSGEETTGAVAPPSAAPTDLRILVLYTDDARLSAGSTSAMESEAEDYVDEVNDVFANSGIAGNAVLAGTREIDINEAFASTAADWTDWLHTRLKDSDSIIAKKRDSVNADVVALVVNSLPDACGRAITVGASSKKAGYVVQRSCATSNLSFTHELGHLFGARHDRYVDKTWTSAHGYIDHPNKVRTIMAYNDECEVSGYSCERLPVFSSAGTWGGYAIGTSKNDNSAKISSEYEDIASYGEAL